MPDSKDFGALIDENAYKIVVAVALAGSPDAVDVDQLARHVRISVQTMADELELPVRIDVSVTHTHESNADRGDYSVHVDSVPCRTDLPELAISEEFDVIALARVVHQTVFVNRHLLAPQSVIARLVDDADAPSREAVRRALRLCQRQGVVREASVDAVSRLSEFAFIHRLEQMFGHADVLDVNVGTELYERLLNSTTRSDGRIKSMREAIYYDLGLKAPLIRIAPDRDLREAEAALALGAVSRAAHYLCPPDEFLVWGDDQNDKGRPTLHPVRGTPGRILRREELDELSDSGEAPIEYFDWHERFVLGIEGHLRRHAAELFTLHSLEEAFGRLADAFPLLIVNVIERFPLPTLLDVHRYLLSERWSVRDLRSILEAMLEVNAVEGPVRRDEVLFTPATLRVAPRDPRTSANDDVGIREYGAYIRIACAPQTMWQHSLTGATSAVATSEVTENALRSQPDGFNSDAHEQLIRTVAHTFDRVWGWETPTLITASDVRRRLWEMVRIDYPHAKVLSRQEIRSGASYIDAFSEIDWAPEDRSA